MNLTPESQSENVILQIFVDLELQWNSVFTDTRLIWTPPHISYKEAEPLTSKMAAEVARAFNKIYKRGPLKWPSPL